MSNPQNLTQQATKGVFRLPLGYADVLNVLKIRIRSAQTKAALASNRELVQLYWDIGKNISERQETAKWGKSVVERLAKDLQKEFPEVGGFSERNLWRMRAFYLAWTGSILSQPATESGLPEVVASLPWFHNVMLIESLKDPSARLWYAQKCVEQGWSRSTLASQIKLKYYQRKGKAVTNFKTALMPPISDLANEIIKDPYIFDFLTLANPLREREVEDQLVGHIAKLLLEMGAGFAFVGRQVPLEVSGKEYFLDLLFYHTYLHCYVVVELKAVEFKPEYAGKLNFYLSAVDDRMRRADDQPTIGLLLCRGKDKIDVEYALRDIHKPIGVAEWATKLVKRLPENLRPNLPTVKEIESALKDLKN